jgi:DoxX-like family
MTIAYLATTTIVALIVAFSALGKIRRDPAIVKVIVETVGVPAKYLMPLAACELAGAAGLLAGIVWPPLGVAAGVALVIYFVGAVVSHLRVGDVKGIGPAAFMLFAAAAALALRVLTMGREVGA